MAKRRAREKWGKSGENRVSAVEAMATLEIVFFIPDMQREEGYNNLDTTQFKYYFDKPINSSRSQRLYE